MVSVAAEEEDIITIISKRGHSDIAVPAAIARSPKATPSAYIGFHPVRCGFGFSSAHAVKFDLHTYTKGSVKRVAHSVDPASPTYQQMNLGVNMIRTRLAKSVKRNAGVG